MSGLTALPRQADVVSVRREQHHVIASPEGVAIQCARAAIGAHGLARAAKLGERTGLPRRYAPRNDGIEASLSGLTALPRQADVVSVRREQHHVIASPQGVAIQCKGCYRGARVGEAAKLGERTGLPRRYAPRNDGIEASLSGLTALPRQADVVSVRRDQHHVIASPQGVAIQC
ncbi:hypothetical protein CCR84_01850, partial [Rhodocyclus purpureus]|nr:hypothetical protein [Rhodocyclus purpureus]